MVTEAREVTAEYYMYVENSRAGILKRSGMDVTAISPSQTMPLYSVSSMCTLIHL